MGDKNDENNTKKLVKTAAELRKVRSSRKTIVEDYYDTQLPMSDTRDKLITFKFRG